MGVLSEQMFKKKFKRKFGKKEEPTPVQKNRPELTKQQKIQKLQNEMRLLVEAIKKDPQNRSLAASLQPELTRLKKQLAELGHTLETVQDVILV